METNEMNYRKALNSNIILFFSYGILTGFIFILISFIIKCALINIHNTLLSVTLSLISGIIIFYLLRFSCRSSTFETLRKIQISDKYSNKFLSSMNLIFILCIITSIIICIGYIFINNSIFSISINNAYETYSAISTTFAEQVAASIREEYNQTIISRVASCLIIELSLVTSFLSLIPYQKELLEKYNNK